MSTDLERARNAVSFEAALYQGRLWEYLTDQALPGSGSVSFSFVCGPQDCVIHALSSYVSGGNAIELGLEIFHGGTVAGGTPMARKPSNHSLHVADPMTEANEGVTVSVAGTQFGRYIVSNTVSSSRRGQTGPMALLAANQPYYVTATNLTNQASNLMLDLWVSSMPYRPTLDDRRRAVVDN